MSQIPSRQGVADLAKGIAVLFMIQVHLMEVFANPYVYGSRLGFVSLFLGGPLVAPVFMVLLGYFLGRTKRTTKALLWRGAGLLLIAFLLNVGLNAHLLLRVASGKMQVNPWEFVFGADILYLASCSIFIIALLRPLHKRFNWAGLLAIVLVVSITQQLSDLLTVSGNARYLLAFVAGRYHWSYFPIFPWLAYPLLGFTFSLYEVRLAGLSAKRAMLAIGMITSIVLLAAFFANAADVAVHLESYYHHGPWFFAWTAILLSVWFVVLSQLEKHASEARVIQFMKWVGRYVLIFYIVQWLIIGNIGTALYRSQSASQWALWFVAVTSLTVIIVFAIQRGVERFSRHLRERRDSSTS